ncbi:competence protein ComER [Oikeobacillus pervagus]|uniref:Competence protein ComER n=1 Tax=Oikeobacillus pervagus TaxID=1325931 RepID=A0AAJ1T8Y8_9BACI|nr:late competence protein ComER [Oikeobacillus pervagus]MDQ0216800.1 competence protein ComER [Oikeobacillus pervagus]
MKIGIIGTGNMGSIIMEALLEAKAIPPSSLYIYNRTLEKAVQHQKNYPQITVCQSNGELIETCDLIFICVKPKQSYPLLQQHQQLFTRQKCVVSITSPISTDQLESVVSSSCIRMIPSITNRALSGITLFTFGNCCEKEWKEYLWTTMKMISTPIEIEENITRVASDIVSCGPAFFSYLTRKFINGAVNQTEIDETKATILASEMLIGLGELLKKKIYTLPTLQEKVCVKGGITGEGIRVLEDEIGEMFEKLFQATHEKFAEDLTITKNQFG